MLSLHRAGGRVKAAGLGLDALFPDEARRYADDPSPERAARLRAAFSDLQSAPPPELLAAFFPHDRRRIKAFLARSGLYRPFLKTDQGPPGLFLPFVTGNGEALRPYRIEGKEGVAVPEAHMAERLAEDPVARAAGDRIGSHYRRGELGACFRALTELADHVGFRRRKAKVGRGLFFFCNAGKTDAPITAPEQTCAAVERLVNEVVERVRARAADARRRFRDGAPLTDALAAADAVEPAEPVEPGLYLQADVYLAVDGKIEIEQIHLPDVGLFLTELPSPEHEVLPTVQKVVGGLRAQTQKLLGTLPSPTYLVTRQAVVESQNDTLEHLEIQALRKMAEEVGLDLRVATPADVADLPRGTQLLLLNVDPSEPDCEPLLRRCAHGELACTPDPFLKLFAAELTTIRRAPVRGRHLERFLESIRPGRHMTGGSFHAIHQAVERVYDLGGLSAEILHFEVPGEHTPVPTLKHSVHSFTTLYNRCKRHGFPELHVREVPIHRGNALLRGPWGPHLSALRFYFSRA